MSKRSRSLVTVLASIALLIVIAWLTRGAREEALARVEPAAGELEVTREAEFSSESTREVAEVAESSSADVAIATTPATGAPGADDERAWVTLRIFDEYGATVAGAKVDRLWVRCASQRATSTATPVTEPTSSGIDGVLKLAYPRRFDRDCMVDGLSLSIHHPEFAPYESSWERIEPEIEIVLARGEWLVLSGWIKAPSNVINEFDAPHFSDEVQLEDGDWQTRYDGRRMTARVPVGRHLVQLRHWSEAGVYWSALTEFEVVARQTTELHLELQPSVRLRGRLSDDVPRPVIDGRVSVALFKRNPVNESSSGFLQRFSARIDVDGAFEIPCLRPQRMQLIAICRGWASPRKQAQTPEDLGLELQPGEDWPTLRAYLGDDTLTYPLIDLRGLGELLEVPMERTATLELHAFDDHGAPLPGVSVNAWPNVGWEGVGSSMVAQEFSWRAVTDAKGIARVDSLPAGAHSYRVEHPEFDLPREPPGDPDGDRHRRGLFISGETLRVHCALERIQGN